MIADVINEIQLMSGFNVYFVMLDILKQNQDMMESILNAEERYRANRFLDPINRHRFIVSHYFLRIILGNHLSLSPELIEFTRSPSGKPILAGVPSEHGFHFSMAHSTNIAIYAISSGLPIGIDLERIQEIPDARSIARRFFTDAEFTALDTVESAKFSGGFFRIWTAKESILKMTGVGIAGLKTIDAASIVQPLALNSILPLRFIINNRYDLTLFQPVEGYMAAIATWWSKR